MQSRSLVFPFVSFYHSPRFVCFFCFPGRKSNFAFVAVQIYYSISCSTIYVCRRKLYNCLCEVRARVCLTSVFVYVCLLHCAYNLYRIQTASNSEMDDALDMKSLDIMFQPSLWSKRYSTPEEVLNEHIAFAKAESDRVRSTIAYNTVRYGEVFTNESFDIYGTDLPKDAPIHVFIHGGYWQELDKTISAYIVRPLVENGIKVIVVDYDLCPGITLSQLVEQVQRAGRFIVEYATKLGSKGIQLSGHSAGAHLAFYMFDGLAKHRHQQQQQLLLEQQQQDEQDEQYTIPSIVKSMYLMSGVYDLCELRFTSTVNANNILALDDETAVQLSPLRFDFTRWTAVRMPAINVYVGVHDAPKLIEHSHHLSERLAVRHGFANVRLFVMDEYDHFNIVEELAKSEYQITRAIIDEAKSF